MSKLRLHPHRTAADGAVEFGSWWVWLNGQRMLAEDRLKGWDYEAETRFEIQPSFDESLLVESTGIHDLSALSIVGLVDCAATGQRFASRISLAELLASEDRSLFIELPSGEVAEQVRLSAHLVLTSAPEASNGAATRPGSRLAESPAMTVRLEGDGARFPTEEVSFKALQIEEALWALRCDFSDLEDSFLGSVRLLINSDHEASSLLLDDSLAGSAVAQSVLRFDVARQLFMHVAIDPHFVVPHHHEYVAGSVGHALASMATLYMNSDLATVVQSARTKLSDFERRLQAGFELMRPT